MMDTALKNHITTVLGSFPAVVAHVRVAQQHLSCMVNGIMTAEYPVSTAARGTGNREGSNQTPLGVHRIAEKYGDNAPVGRILRDRCDTGNLWRPGDPSADLVLTRILRLEGMESGVNRGPGIDSYERYIYIHGTSKEALIGTPVSHGCIVMRNADVIDLFNRVKEGDCVCID